MIRILHSVSNMDRAGIETILMNYYRQIDRKMLQFDFLCNKTKPGAYDEEILSMGGRIFHSPGLNPLNFNKYQRYMTDLFSKYPEYHIVHVHNGALGVYALVGAMRNKIPHRIFHAHGASITKDIKMPLKLFCKSLLKANTNHRWACGAMAAKCYYGTDVFDKNDYRIIHNAIDLSRFVFNNTVREKLRKEYGLNGRYVIGHVGRFMKQKNHSFLLDIFAAFHKKNRNAVLVLLGEGELMPVIKKKAKDIGLENNIYFVGNVDNANEWYQAFDIFLLPSIWEGLPVVGVEAQAASLPCLFSSLVTTEVKILPNAQYLSLNKPAEAWAEKLLSMSSMPPRVDCSEAIRAAGYDITTEARKLQDLYYRMENQ